jgi:hypothetical protein
MYSLKVVNRQKQITVHKPILRKVEEVRDLFQLAGADLHVDAAVVVGILNDVIRAQGGQRLGAAEIQEPVTV